MLILLKENKIAKNFKEFFDNIGLNIAVNILDEKYKFVSYIPEAVTFSQYSEPNEVEFETILKSLKRDEKSGFDMVNVNIVNIKYLIKLMERQDIFSKISLKKVHFQKNLKLPKSNQYTELVKRKY